MSKIPLTLRGLDTAQLSGFDYLCGAAAWNVAYTCPAGKQAFAFPIRAPLDIPVGEMFVRSTETFNSKFPSIHQVANGQTPASATAPETFLASPQIGRGGNETDTPGYTAVTLGVFMTAGEQIVINSAGSGLRFQMALFEIDAAESPYIPLNVGVPLFNTYTQLYEVPAGKIAVFASLFWSNPNNSGYSSGLYITPNNTVVVADNRWQVDNANLQPNGPQQLETRGWVGAPGEVLAGHNTAPAGTSRLRGCYELHDAPA